MEIRRGKGWKFITVMKGGIYKVITTEKSREKEKETRENRKNAKRMCQCKKKIERICQRNV